MQRGFPYVIDRVRLTDRLVTTIAPISNRWLKSTIPGQENSGSETCESPTFPSTPQQATGGDEQESDSPLLSNYWKKIKNEFTVELCAFGTG